MCRTAARAAVPSVILLYTLICFTGCKTVIPKIVEGGGDLLNNASKSITTIEKTKLDVGGTVTRRIAGGSKAYMEIKIDAMPFITLYSCEPDSEGSIEFTELRYLAGNYSGWNEFFIDLVGTANFKNKSLILKTPLNFGSITRAAIKRNSTRLYAERALEGTRAREMRVKSITQWMKESTYGKTWEELNGGQKTENGNASLKDFQKYWQAILLPETLKRKDRPQVYEQTQMQSAKDQYVSAEGIKWNTAYTKIIFSNDDELIPVRDGGALLRDWEEASPWFYLYYYWDALILSHTSSSLKNGN